MLQKLPKLLSSQFTVHSSQKGQALIILLLVMVVALTIGLSVASRTITDVQISTQSEQSQKAFSAAEAGIEHALRQGFQVLPFTTTNVIGEASYNVEVVSQGAASSFTPQEQPVVKDDVSQLNLDGTGATRLNIYWIDQANLQETGNLASLEITEVYQDGPNYKIAKYAFNADCTRPNGFSCVSHGGALGGHNYDRKTTITLNTNPKLLRLRPLYNSASVAVEVAAPVGATLPGQTVRITSTGTTGSITRKVEVTRAITAASPIFDYVLYSGTNLEK